jgi:hypothetical protein
MRKIILGSEHPKNQRHTMTRIAGFDFANFDYEEYGVKGVGKNRLPFVNMDKYVDNSKNTELHIESCIGLAKIRSYELTTFYGDIPPEEKELRSVKDIWSVIVANLNRYDPTGVHRAAIENIIDTTDPSLTYITVYKYCYFAMNAIIPWYFSVFLRRSLFKDKTNNTVEWENCSNYFPKLKSYIDTLPFKDIGRVLFFTTLPNQGVITHRDSVVKEHKDHNINFFFDQGTRPSFIWDEIKKEKLYLERGATSYFFNNRDYHGVDPEPNFRYTLRIDGTFSDELCDELGLDNGYTWKWDYEK